MRRTGAWGTQTKQHRTTRSTIVKRLINGTGAVPAIPVVWGISATVERFNKAMEGAEGRSTLPNVVVDSAQVQESGLLKDTIILDIPDEVGQFDTVLVRRATDKLKESTAAWAEYAKQQDDAEIVMPLMVLQVPNTPDPNDIGRALDTIFQQWPELPNECYRPCVRRAHYADFWQTRRATYLPRTCAGIELGARADREGCHQHRVGLPARRGDGVFPPGERSHPHHPVAGAHGPNAARPTHSRQRSAQLGGLPAAIFRCQVGCGGRRRAHEGWRGRRRHAADRASGAHQPERNETEPLGARVRVGKVSGAAVPVLAAARGEAGEALDRAGPRTRRGRTAARRGQEGARGDAHRFWMRPKFATPTRSSLRARLC